MDKHSGARDRDHDEKPVHVLLADDEPGLAELTAEHLEKEFDRLSTAWTEDPSEALERVEEDLERVGGDLERVGEDFDCVVSDYDMPDMDGLELLKKVREVRPELPFLLHTGKGNEEVASEAIQAGVSDYVVKDTGEAQYQALGERILDSVDGFVASRRLEYSEERWRNLMENSPHPISIVQDDEIAYANPAFVDLVDADTSSEVVGETYLDFVAREYRESVGRLVERVERDLVSFDRREGMVRTSIGREKPVSVVTTPISFERSVAVQVVFTEDFVNLQYRGS